MPVKFRDYYETLGVAKTATEDDIRKAFRKLARQYHPDVAKGNKQGAEEKFKEINEAYEVLGDPAKRQQYDELGSSWPGGGGNAGNGGNGGGFPGGAGGFFRTRPGRGGGQEYEFDGSTGFSDFFEQFFGPGAARGRGGAGAGFGVPPREGPPRPTDAEADLMVTLEEALAGGKRVVTLRRQTEDGGGGGVESRPEVIEVKIPAGVHGGQRIRLRGRGQHGGDLYLRVRLARHPDFRVEDNGDVFHDLPLGAPQAVLGVTADVPTLEGGRAKLKIPAGSQPGQKFRLRGKGMPGPGVPRGDLYVRLDVQLPKTLSPEERTRWEALAEPGAE